MNSVASGGLFFRTGSGELSLDDLPLRKKVFLLLLLKYFENTSAVLLVNCSMLKPLPSNIEHAFES